MRHVKDKETKCLYVVVIRAASETKDRVTYERFVEVLEGKIGQYLEEATMQTITDGVVTGDLAALMDPKPQAVTSEEFIGGIRERLAKKLGC